MDSQLLYLGLILWSSMLVVTETVSSWSRSSVLYEESHVAWRHVLACERESMWYWNLHVVLPRAVAVFLVCSNLKTIKGDLIPYLVRQQFIDKKPSVPSDDTDWGSLMLVLYIWFFENAFSVFEKAVGRQRIPFWQSFQCVLLEIWLRFCNFQIAG